MAAGTSIITAKLTPRVRLARMWNGISGSLTVRSITMNATSSTAPRPRAVRVTGSLQVLSACVDTRLDAWVSPYTSESRPSVPVTAPGMSRATRRGLLSASTIGAMTAAAMPIGTLMRNVQRHEYSVSQPPRIRPTAAPAPDIAA